MFMLLVQLWENNAHLLTNQIQAFNAVSISIHFLFCRIAILFVPKIEILGLLFSEFIRGKAARKSNYVA